MVGLQEMETGFLGAFVCLFVEAQYEKYYSTSRRKEEE